MLMLYLCLTLSSYNRLRMINAHKLYSKTERTNVEKYKIQAKNASTRHSHKLFPSLVLYYLLYYFLVELVDFLCSLFVFIFVGFICFLFRINYAAP